jgi:hypothetical protein
MAQAILTDHSVIVQVKKKQERATKRDLLTFHSVVLDIPGSIGLFVSEQGYQKGALEVARGAGITTYEIRKVVRNRSPIQITTLSIGRFTLKPHQVALEQVFLQPDIKNLQVTLDEQWMAEHPDAWPGTMAITTTIDRVRFFDAAGNERSSIQRLVQDHLREFGDAGQTSLQTAFSDPTYMSGIELVNKDGTPLGNLKIVSLTCTLDVTKTTVTSPLFSPTTTTYLFKNAIESDRYALVAERGPELAAILSVKLRSSPGPTVSQTKVPGA